MRFLHIMLRAICRGAGPAGVLSQWLATGTAAVLALLIGNLQHLTAVLREGNLRAGILVLVISLLAGVAATVLAIAVRNSTEVSEQLLAEFATPESQMLLAEARDLWPNIRREMLKPMFGPIKWAFKWGLDRGGADPLAGYKSNIRLLSIFSCLAVAQYLTALVGIAILAIGLVDPSTRASAVANCHTLANG